MAQPPSASEAQVIAADWGTTHLRVWLLDASGQTLEARSSEDGMNRLAGDPSAFANAYDRLIDGWPGVPGLACGMVGARQGWAEAPYVPVPARLDRLLEGAVWVESGQGRRLAILPGLCQRHPADVMRGEETKLLGLLRAAEAAGARAALLVGTHAKHVRLRGDTVEGFTSVPTGELFDVLAHHSILRFSVEDDDPAPDAFAAAVRQGAALGAGGLGVALFELRARSLLLEVPPGETRARLSGLLIGAELGLLPAEAPMLLVASAPLTEPYAMAFRALERPEPRLVDGEGLVLRGLGELARGLVG